MIYALVRFTVEDFAKWRSVFEEAGAIRKAYGSVSAQAFQKSDSKNEITVLLQFESRERAGQMFQSPEFREITKRGGMVAPPEVTFLDEVAKLPS
jgi:quinol monooxygenase YgiN